MSFFTFDYLIKILKTSTVKLQTLDLSNTKISEKNSIELLEAVLVKTEIMHLNLSRNMNVSYKFAAYALFMVKNIPNYSL